MKNIELEKLEEIQGGGFWTSLASGILCGAAITSVGMSGGMSAPLAYITCGVAIATVLEQ